VDVTAGRFMMVTLISYLKSYSLLKETAVEGMSCSLGMEESLGGKKGGKGGPKRRERKREARRASIPIFLILETGEGRENCKRGNLEKPTKQMEGAPEIGRRNWGRVGLKTYGLKKVGPEDLIMNLSREKEMTIREKCDRPNHEQKVHKSRALGDFLAEGGKKEEVVRKLAARNSRKELSKDFCPRGREGTKEKGRKERVNCGKAILKAPGRGYRQPPRKKVETSSWASWKRRRVKKEEGLERIFLSFL